MMDRAGMETSRAAMAIDPWKEYRERVFADLGYVPTPLQAPIFLDEHQIRLVAGGWRAGKSFVGAKEIVLRVPRSRLIWIVAKNYDMSVQEFKEYLIPDLLKLEFVDKKFISTPQQGQMSLTTIHGCRVETRSAEDVIKIGQVSPDFILVAEAAQISFDAFLRLQGRLMESKGSMMLTGTFETDVGWYVEYFKKGQGYDPDLKSFSLPSWSNTVVFPGGRGDPEIARAEQRLGPLFKLYCAAIPSPPQGIVIPEFSNEIHTGNYPYDPSFPVALAIDPGYGGAYAVEVIQVRESIPYIVDEIYLQGYTTEDIIRVCKKKPWVNNIVSGGSVIDIAARQHQAMAAPIEVWSKPPDKDDWYNGGLGLYLNSKFVEVEGGINTLRSFMAVHPVTHKPGVYINATATGIISECGGCKSPVPGGGAWVRNTDNGKLVDKNNHALKAFIYYLVYTYGYTGVNVFDDYGKLQRFDGKDKKGRFKWLKNKN